MPILNNLFRVKRCPILAYKLNIQLKSCTKLLSTWNFSDNFCSVRRRKFLKMNSSTFLGKVDFHKGITIESATNPCTDILSFKKKLEGSLVEWKKENLRGVWFKVGMSQINWVPILSEYGFKIHHAHDEEITMCLWLPDNEPSKIPHYAHYMIGAGAVVLNDQNQILVVRERYRSVPFWKLPGGHVDPGEDVGEAAIREVLEETSIQTEFVSLISIRQTSKAVFDCSDLYFIVRLRPLSDSIKKQDEEIEDCKWMDIEEYLNHPEVHANNRMFVRQAIYNEKDGIFMRREADVHPVTNKPQHLYTIHKVDSSP